MHTAICTFQDRETAERARHRLLGAGFAADDVHLQHRGGHDADAMGEDPRAWEGAEREIAVSRETLDRVAGFFVRLFGQEHPDAHHRRYAEAVEQGHYVLVVDTMDQTEAQRARELLHEHSAAELNVVHRPAQGPMREWVGTYGAEPPVVSGTAAPARTDSASAWSRTQAQSTGRAAWTGERGDRGERAEADRERALAAGDLGEQRPLDLRDPDRRDDQDHVGLRYADKDKPGV
ncbi:MAG TPA: hypothetical protein VEA40_05535 [Ramlibacter sp.]|nr:hypothetical protein [Ramlibacter sp.]